jgi:hypothetical protein
MEIFSSTSSKAFSTQDGVIVKQDPSPMENDAGNTTNKCERNVISN